MEIIEWTQIRHQMDRQMDICIAYFIEVSGEARCTAFGYDIIIKLSSCSYFPW